MCVYVGEEWRMWMSVSLGCYRSAWGQTGVLLVSLGTVSLGVLLVRLGCYWSAWGATGQPGVLPVSLGCYWSAWGAMLH